MVVIYCYLERENEEILKFHVNSFCYFKINGSLFNVPPSSACSTLKR